MNRLCPITLLTLPLPGDVRVKEKQRPACALGCFGESWHCMGQTMCLDLWGSAEVEEVWRSSGRLLDKAAGLALLTRIIPIGRLKSRHPLGLILMAKEGDRHLQGRRWEEEKLPPHLCHMKIPYQAGSHTWVGGGTPCISGGLPGKAGMTHS